MNYTYRLYSYFNDLFVIIYMIKLLSSNAYAYFSCSTTDNKDENMNLLADIIISQRFSHTSDMTYTRAIYTL